MSALAAGDLLHLTSAASVQFGKPILFRLIRVMTDRITYDGWIWIEGYQLDEKGDAVARRELFVQPAGLRKLNPSPRSSTGPGAPRGRDGGRRATPSKARVRG
ncbi:hypothetical protein [Micromonospora sp. DT233]|uniref:hypothetical protein n=1 Tax=Micromonospora sp. DT233 TaxID=3393432 RepID=UPI003CFAF2F9